MTLRRSLVAAGIAIVVALVCAALGVEAAFAVGWGLVAGVVVLLTQLTLPDEPRVGGPVAPEAPTSRLTEISRLAWALNPSTGLAAERVTRRVRGILLHRLERIGLDPENPNDRAQCAAQIGPDLWGRLTGQGTTITDIERALEAIERLSPTKEKQ